MMYEINSRQEPTDRTEVSAECEVGSTLPSVLKLGLVARAGVDGGRQWEVREQDPRRARLDDVPLLIDG